MKTYAALITPSGHPAFLKVIIHGDSEADALSTARAIYGPEPSIEVHEVT